MSFWVILALTCLSGIIVAFGLFNQVAAITQRRRSFKGIVFKFLGLIPLFLAIRGSHDEVVSISVSFFVTASITLVFLTLARKRLLR